MWIQKSVDPDNQQQADPDPHCFQKRVKLYNLKKSYVHSVLIRADTVSAIQ